ncbi:hypothetical protein GCM10009837_50570 [Streptomyces durmitorensis]|uniref:Uncharacterized protein n=1 Tax=Streptomyces durmitorensis TaxID=319947 RepID=A0ABY4PYF3_9ACTN|nr:DUF6578 domain-containing protein [Streptomyces durmitorensis]UQT58890.1 hypothetical protein M4V62_29700 [Streptomyces durmitorensis]
MALWNVLYDDWQMECCGTPFSVGDEVAWQLGGGPPLYSVERHGDEGPDTVGRVRSIQVVTREFTLRAGTQTFEQVAGAEWLRPVEKCPKWFADPVEGCREQGRFRREVGVLVSLDVREDGG